MEHLERIAIALEKIAENLGRVPVRKKKEKIVADDFYSDLAIALSGFTHNPSMRDICRKLNLPESHEEKVRVGRVLRSLGWEPYRETRKSGDQKQCELWRETKIYRSIS